MRLFLMSAAVAGLHLAADATPVLAGKRSPAAPFARTPSTLAALARGPTLSPGAVILTDEAGRQRTLELDDLAPLRLRVSIPF